MKEANKKMVKSKQRRKRK